MKTSRKQQQPAQKDLILPSGPNLIAWTLLKKRPRKTRKKTSTDKVNKKSSVDKK